LGRGSSSIWPSRRTLVENPLAGKVCWKKDLSIAPILLISKYLEMYYFVDEFTLYVDCIPGQRGKSTKSVFGSSDNLLRR
jgi:hypothetical protein